MSLDASDSRDDLYDNRPRVAFDTGLRIDSVGDAYALRLAPAHGLLHMRIAGFWSHARIAHFASDLAAAVALLGTPPGAHLICCDVTDASIQSQDVVAAFQDLIAHGPTRARKLALFTTRVLPRMQARRIVGVREQIAVFATEAAALAWLLDDAAGLHEDGVA